MATIWISIGPDQSHFGQVTNPVVPPLKPISSRSMGNPHRGHTWALFHAFRFSAFSKARTPEKDFQGVSVGTPASTQGWQALYLLASCRQAKDLRCRSFHFQPILPLCLFSAPAHSTSIALSGLHVSFQKLPRPFEISSRFELGKFSLSFTQYQAEKCLFQGATTRWCARHMRQFFAAVASNSTRSRRGVLCALGSPPGENKRCIVSGSFSLPASILVRTF